MSDFASITPSASGIPAEPEQYEFSMGRSHGHKPVERTDIASGKIMNPARMIRLAFNQDGDMVADLSAKLPGRGAWIVAKREAVEAAVKSKAFARAAKRNVNVPDGFADQIDELLSRRVLGLIGMANRAGEMESGFDKVRGIAQTGKLAFRIEASDGSEDGRSKIRVIAKAVAKGGGQLPAPVVGCYTSEQLGKILGREHMVHLAVRKGRVAQSLRAELSRLAGFRALFPETWPDKEHELPFNPFGDG